MDLKSLPGKIILNSYEVLKVLGAGGMGTVYLARQIDLDRLVAIKILDADGLADADAMPRFEREAKTISQLSHRNITQFYSYGVISENNPFIVMEFVDGLILSQLIANAQPAIHSAQATKIAIQVAEALSYAHAHGIIHRDLKPDNIMVLSKPEIDFVKLLDFGLSKLASGNEEQRLTQTGAVMGTPRYMSPEQSMGQKLDLRADVYSLGCILYEMVCGKAPFDADSPVGVIYKHTNERPRRPSLVAPRSLPAGLELVILKCLEKDPAARYQSMDALLQDLQLIKQNNGDLIDIQLSYEEKQKGNNQLAKMALVTCTLAVLMLSAGAAFYYSNLQHKAVEMEQKNIAGKKTTNYSTQVKASPVQQLKKIEECMLNPQIPNRASMLEKIPQSVDELIKTQKLSRSILYTAYVLKARAQEEYGSPWQNTVESLQKALACCKDSSGAETEEASYCYYRIAGVLYAQQKLLDAQKQIEKSLEIEDLRSRPNSEVKSLDIPAVFQEVRLNSSKNPLTLYGLIEHGLGNNKKSLQLFNQALSLMADDNPIFSNTAIEGKANTLRSLGQLSAASEVLIKQENVLSDVAMSAAQTSKSGKIVPSNNIFGSLVFDPGRAIDSLSDLSDWCSKNQFIKEAIRGYKAVIELSNKLSSHPQTRIHAENVLAEIQASTSNSRK